MPYRPTSRAQYQMSGPPGWNAIPGVTRILLVAIAAVYLISLAANGLIGWLVLEPALATRGLQLWRFVTYPVVHTSIVSVLLYGYMVWAFGSRQERVDGSRRYAWFLVLSSLVAGGLGALVDMLLHGGGERYAGAGGLITTFLILWAFREPEQEILAFFVVPLKVKWLVMIVVAIVVFSEIEHGFSLARVLYVLGGAPVAWYWARGGRLDIPGLRLRERYYRAKLNRLRKKQGLRAVRDDESPPGGWVN